MAGAPRREALRVTTGPLAPSLGDQVVKHVVVVGRVAETWRTCWSRQRRTRCLLHPQPPAHVIRTTHTPRTRDNRRAGTSTPGRNALTTDKHTRGGPPGSAVKLQRTVSVTHTQHPERAARNMPSYAYMVTTRGSVTPRRMRLGTARRADAMAAFAMRTVSSERATVTAGAEARIGRRMRR